MKKKSSVGLENRSKDLEEYFWFLFKNSKNCENKQNCEDLRKIKDPPLETKAEKHLRTPYLGGLIGEVLG